MKNHPQIGSQNFVTIENESIYFESYGSGETVVLCHGLGGNHAIWYQQVPMLAQTHRVITWDQRGFGRSSNHTGQASPRTAARDLCVLLDHLEIEQAHLIGQSMGGWAVLGFTLEHPQRTKSLVLADTVAGIYTPAIAKAYDTYNQNRPVPQEMPFGHHPAVGMQLVQNNLAQAFLYSQIGSVAEPPPTDMFMLLRDTAYPLDAVSRLPTRTLFIVGCHDPIFPPTLIHEAATQLSNARVIEIPDTGHSPYFEAPQQWNEAVCKFLREQS